MPDRVRHDGMMKSKILLILGPTAVGKTGLSIQLAKALQGEIIVADSQSVYKGFDIGTAKPSLEERADVAHHLIDVAEFGEAFDAARFADLADQVISQIAQRGKVPIVAGGTGLYLKALLHGFMEAPPRNKQFRKKLDWRIDDEGLEKIYEELQQKDPERAAEIHPNDIIRITRALEICHVSGKKPSELAKEHRFQGSKYEALKIGLKIPRDDLYRRINQRVLTMLNQGWVEEVKGLLAKGYDLRNDRSKTIGYPILAKLIKKEIFVNDAIKEIQQETRQLAKRQLSWFRADPEIQWFDPENFAGILEASKKFLS